MGGQIENKAFHLLVVVVTLAFFWLLLPFFGAVFWAVILAIVFQPLQALLERRFGAHSNLAALLSVIICIVLAIIPVILIVGALVGEIAALVQRVQSGQFDPTVVLNEFREMLPPRVDHWFEQIGVDDFGGFRTRVIEALQQAGQYLAARILSVGQNTLRFVAGTGIMLYVLFFLFRDGRQVARNIRRAMPFREDKNRALLEKFAAVIRATVKGNIVIAVLQGAIGGVTFWGLGISGALLWGVLMTFLSLLPAVGSALIWVPTAVYLFVIGAVWKGVILVLVGVMVIGLVDNLLRPMLVGKDTRLPDYVVLVSTIGGLSLFGINGFVIGPLIAALFVVVWELFRDQREARERPPLP